MKVCNKCLLEKELYDFAIDRRVPSGRTGQCKLCRELVTKDWRSRNRQKVNAYLEKWEKENLVKRLAQETTYNAIRSGILTREPCWVCGGKAEAHHVFYDEPLMVSWLCKKHHVETHKLLRQK